MFQETGSATSFREVLRRTKGLSSSSEGVTSIASTLGTPYTTTYYALKAWRERPVEAEAALGGRMSFTELRKTLSGADRCNKTNPKKVRYLTREVVRCLDRDDLQVSFVELRRAVKRLSEYVQSEKE